MKSAYPQDAVAFKTWADAACTAWPEHLTAAAYWAWCYLAKTVSNAEYLTDFDAAYAAFRKSQEVA